MENERLIVIKKDDGSEWVAWHDKLHPEIIWFKWNDGRVPQKQAANLDNEDFWKTFELKKEEGKR